MKLTAKQQAFIKEYLIDLNSTQAAIRAGYSHNTATEIGWENLRKPHIKEAIDVAMNKRSEKLGITADKVLQELAYIAFADTTEFVSLEPVKIKDESGEEIIVGTVKFKFTDDLSPNQKKAIQSIKMGANGIELKLHDKIKSLELLGKHLKLFTDKVEQSGETTHNIKTQSDLSKLSVEELKELESILSKTSDTE